MEARRAVVWRQRLTFAVNIAADSPAPSMRPSVCPVKVVEAVVVGRPRPTKQTKQTKQ